MIKKTTGQAISRFLHPIDIARKIHDTHLVH